VSEAWFGFLGVIVGAVVSLLGQQIAAKQEEKARQALRTQELKDRRDASQRDDIRALQEAIAQYWPMVTTARIAAGKPLKLIGNPEVSALHWRINMLRARIFDDDLRSLAGQVQKHVHGASKASDVASLEHHGQMADRCTRQMDKRVNILLKDLS